MRDPGEVERLSGLVRRVLAPNPSHMTGPGTNTYLLGGEGTPVTVVDPGPADDAHLEALLRATGGQVGAIVVTHTHSDHSPGAAALAERTGAPVMGWGPMLRPGVEHHDDAFRADRLLRDGDRLERDDHVLAVLHTPGHATNHLCFLLEDGGQRLLLTGDHVMQGSTVVIAPLDGDMATYLAELRRVAALRPDRLLPGHGEVMDDPISVVRQLLEHRQQRHEQIAALLASRAGGATPAELVEAAYPDVSDQLRPIAEHQVWAVLRRLREEGRAGLAAPVEEERLEREATWTT